MTTLLDIIITLFKGNLKKYRLFIICNVISIGILFSLRMMLDNTSLNNVNIVDPMISSNVFAPTLFMHLFEIFFIPYTLILLNRQIVNNYGVLLSVGLSERQFVSCILVENALVIVISVVLGMITGVALEFGLIMIIKHIIKIQIVVFSQNIVTYYQTIAFLLIVYMLSIVTIVITNIRKKIFNIINDGRKAECGKEHKCLFIIGLLCFVISLTGSLILFERTGGNIMLLGIVFSYIGLALVCCNIDFLLKKMRAKWLFIVSDYEYYHKTNKKLCIMLIAIYGVLFFINTVSLVMESGFKKDVTVYYPYDMVFTQDKTENADDGKINEIFDSFDVDVRFQLTVPYFYIGGFSIFGTDDVNIVTGNSFIVPKGHFLFVRSVAINDGYVHEKGFVPDEINIVEKNFKLYEDIDCMLFCRGGGLTDSIVLINQEDYERISKKLSNEKSLRLFCFENKGYQEGLADCLEKQSGSDVASYYEAYKRASQSSDILYLLMGYISIVMLSCVIITVYYKIEFEKEKDIYKYRLLMAIGAEQDFIQKCIKEKLIVVSIFPLTISLIWMIIVSYIDMISCNYQFVAIYKCIAIGFGLGIFIYGMCNIYARGLMKKIRHR